jgi:hypothetical protein
VVSGTATAYTPAAGALVVVLLVLLVLVAAL